MAIINAGQPTARFTPTQSSSPPIKADVASGDYAMGGATQQLSQTIGALGFALKQQMDENDFASAMTVYRQRITDLERDLANNPRQIQDSQVRIAGANGVEGAEVEAAELSGEYNLFNNRNALIEGRNEIMSDISDTLLRSGYSRRRFQQWAAQQRIEEDDAMTQFDITQNRSMLFDQLTERLEAIQEEGKAGDPAGTWEKLANDAYEHIRLARDDMGIISQQTADELADKIGNNIAIRAATMTYREAARQDEEAAWDALMSDNLEWTAHDGEVRRLSVTDKEALLTMVRQEGQYWREVRTRESNEEMFTFHNELFDHFRNVTTFEMTPDEFLDTLLNDERGNPFNGMRMDLQNFWWNMMENLRNQWRRADGADGAYTLPFELDRRVQALQSDLSLTDDEYQRSIGKLMDEYHDIPYEEWSKIRSHKKETNRDVAAARSMLQTRLEDFADSIERDNPAEAAIIRSRILHALAEWDETMYTNQEGQLGGGINVDQNEALRIKHADDVANSIFDQITNGWVADMVFANIGRETVDALRGRVITGDNSALTYFEKVALGLAWSMLDDAPDEVGRIATTLQNSIGIQLGNPPDRVENWPDGGIDFFYNTTVEDRNNQFIKHYVLDDQVRFRFMPSDPKNPRSRPTVHIRNPHSGTQPWIPLQDLSSAHMFSFIDSAFVPGPGVVPENPYPIAPFPGAGAMPGDDRPPNPLFPYPNPGRDPEPAPAPYVPTIRTDAQGRPMGID